VIKKAKKVPLQAKVARLSPTRRIKTPNLLRARKRILMLLLVKSILVMSILKELMFLL
jgi:hypothetical protein